MSVLLARGKKEDEISGPKFSKLLDTSKFQKAVKIEAGKMKELFISCVPSPDKQSRDNFEVQVKSMYENLSDLLVRNDASPKDIMTEKLYFSDIDSQFDSLVRIREDFYKSNGCSSKALPAGSFLQQAPCYPGRLCEMQAYAVVPSEKDDLKVNTITSDLHLTVGKSWKYDRCKHIYISNVNGANGADLSAEGFPFQARRMFEHAKSLLELTGAAFTDVVRTWIYLSEIDRDYAAFNKVRTQFYQDNGVVRLPASTGIQGTPYPSKLLCGMDLYALVTDEPIEIRVMHAPTLNEAPKYGSSFSRGMRVSMGNKIVLYVSGTASIDEAGRTVHIGDIEKQINRMFLNVENLLEMQEASVKDIVVGITYLKSANYLDSFEKIRRERGIPDFPNNILVAGVCRPEWLCEIEAIAVVERKIV